jgi:phosphoglycolate phosphatase-like HAD superfamily hydrolase
VTFALFDIDLTLVNTQGAGRAALEAAFHDTFGVVPDTDGLRFDGRTDRAIFKWALSRIGEGSQEAYNRLGVAYLRRLPAALEERVGLVLPGVVELLDGLATDGVALGLATGNMREGARLKLAHFSLWDRFAAGGFGDRHEVRTGVVEAAALALANATGRDLARSDLVVIGDTPLDIEAAHAVGARAIGVATGHYSVPELLSAGAQHAFADFHATPAVAAAVRGTGT